MNAELMMLISGTGAFLVTLFLVRQRRMRVKYALVWLALSFGGLVVGAYPRLLMEFAGWARLSFPAAALLVALGLIYVFSFSVSLSLSQAHRRTTRLLQEVALLEERVRELEARDSSTPFGK